MQVKIQHTHTHTKKIRNLWFALSQHFQFWEVPADFSPAKTWNWISPSPTSSDWCYPSLTKLPAGRFKCQSKCETYYKDPQCWRSAGEHFKEKQTAKCHQLEKSRNKINSMTISLWWAAGIINHKTVFVACPFLTGGFSLYSWTLQGM